MTLDELREHLRRFEKTEIRFDLKDYMEFVVMTATVDEIKGILSTYFGPPVDFKNAHHHSQDLEIAEQWGGVRGNQLLFVKREPGTADFAMIWPWCDGCKASIKIFQYRPLF